MLSARKWLFEICFCSCLTILPSRAWVLLNYVLHSISYVVQLGAKIRLIHFLNKGSCLLPHKTANVQMLSYTTQANSASARGSALCRACQEKHCRPLFFADLSCSPSSLYKTAADTDRQGAFLAASRSKCHQTCPLPEAIGLIQVCLYACLCVH